MTFLWHAFVVVLVVVVVLALAAVATFAVLRRMVHRRWHRVRHHPVTRGTLAAGSSVAAWREHSVAQRTPEALVSGTSGTVRRRLWHAVDAAEDSVRQADQAGAPVAELPMVCRSLHSVATDLSAMLRIERRLPNGHAALRAQSAEVIRAARDVQTAALSAMTDAAEPQLRSLVRTARDEVDILAVALQRMRSATAH